MKKVCAGLVLFVLVTGCQGDADSTDLANSSVKGEKFHPIEPKEQGDLEVIGWFDNQTILYLLSGEDSFEMYRHDIFTGDDELLYSDDQSFHRLDANYNHTRFALQTLNDQDQAELIILNANGEVSSTPTLEADDYSIYWSPYDEAEFMAVAFLPDWKQEVYHIQLDPLSIDKTGIQSSYLQWSSPDSVSYLNWSMIPSIEAPLKQYELSSSKITDGYGSGLF
ncbi:YqgU-like beta propeller domain-containing protein [Alkalicoccobacillus plakortidis]|uniref:YqgU-like 6-bladed beta-propeller domain-containing protein n=1 Tax=Alkalicoccobacillus plakortidis TaxID=444060 RepID=A0ABT0XPG0_9BACI|nr:hypothetical protein [Alkalicoccobacillus plakortidis]MCM2677793.1 hypothetical protein [Alkalicoccobacillus plakortidis]